MYAAAVEPACGARDWRARLLDCLRGTQPQHDPGQWLIPGLTAAESRQYDRFLPRQVIAAAVLVPIVTHESGLTVLFTQRATALKNHAGQISFPGGRVEANDAGPQAAALREAQEEIGLDPTRVTVIGFLPDHIVVSGFRVTPVVAFVEPGFQLRLDAHEVQDTFEVPLDYLFQPANHRPRRRRLSADTEVELCEIPYGERNIWGATAGMLVNLAEVLTR